MQQNKEEKFIGFVEPNKLEFKIITDDSIASLSSNNSLDSMNTSTMSSASSSGGIQEEGFSPESVLEHYLTLLNPYECTISFKIECNKPAHYTLKTPSGSLDSKTEIKMYVYCIIFNDDIKLQLSVHQHV